MLNATFQSHPIKMGCCNTITKCLIVTTINPIWHSHLVHPGTTALTFVALKARKTLSLHTILFLNKTQTKQIVVLIFNQVYFFSLGLDTLFQLQSILTLIV